MKRTYSEIAGLCRPLALLLHAGIGTADGVFLLAEEEMKEMRPLLKELGVKMDEGMTLSEAMKESGAFLRQYAETLFYWKKKAVWSVTGAVSARLPRQRHSVKTNSSIKKTMRSNPTLDASPQLRYRITS